MEMDQLICGGCRTLLMYTRGATSVRCSCCHTVNLAPVSNQLAQVNCGNCRTMLMYPFGAPSVKCAVCHYITNVNMSNGRVPVPVPMRPNGTTTSGSMPPVSTATPHSHNQTVVVENPMSVDESGKLVSNVVVGVTTDKKKAIKWIMDPWMKMVAFKDVVMCIEIEEKENGHYFDFLIF